MPFYADDNLAVIPRVVAEQHCGVCTSARLQVFRSRNDCDVCVGRSLRGECRHMNCLLDHKTL